MSASASRTVRQIRRERDASASEYISLIDDRALPEIKEVFDIPSSVADRMMFGRIRLLDKNRLARSIGRLNNAGGLSFLNSPTSTVGTGSPASAARGGQEEAAGFPGGGGAAGAAAAAGGSATTGAAASGAAAPASPAAAATPSFGQVPVPRRRGEGYGPGGSGRGKGKGKKGRSGKKGKSGKDYNPRAGASWFSGKKQRRPSLASTGDSEGDEAAGPVLPSVDAMANVHAGTKDIGGALGLIGTNNRVFARGDNCFVFTSLLGMTGQVYCDEPVIKLQITAWFAPSVQDMTQYMDIDQLQDVVEIISKQIDATVKRRRFKCLSAMARLNDAAVFDPTANSARAIAKFKAALQRAFQPANMQVMYRDTVRLYIRHVDYPEDEDAERALAKLVRQPRYRDPRARGRSESSGGGDGGSGSAAGSGAGAEGGNAGGAAATNGDTGPATGAAASGDDTTGRRTSSDYRARDRAKRAALAERFDKLRIRKAAEKKRLQKEAEEAEEKRRQQALPPVGAEALHKQFLEENGEAGRWYKGPTRMSETLAQRNLAPQDVEGTDKYNSWQAKRVAMRNSAFRTNMEQPSPYMHKSQTLEHTILSPGPGIMCDTRGRPIARSPIRGRRPSEASDAGSAADQGATSAAAAGSADGSAVRRGSGAGSVVAPGQAPTLELPPPSAGADDDGRRRGKGKKGRKGKSRRGKRGSAGSRASRSSGGVPLSPHADKTSLHRQLEFIWGVFETPFQLRMAHLIDSSNDADAALQMRQRVNALELAAHAARHWYAVSELYEEARLRATEEQTVTFAPVGKVEAARSESPDLSPGPGLKRTASHESRFAPDTPPRTAPPVNDDEDDITAGSALREPLVLPAETMIFLRKHHVLGRSVDPPPAGTPIADLEKWFLWLYRRVIALTVSILRDLGLGTARSLDFRGSNCWNQVRAAAVKYSVDI